MAMYWGMVSGMGARIVNLLRTILAIYLETNGVLWTAAFVEMQATRCSYGYEKETLLCIQEGAIPYLRDVRENATPDLIIPR